MSLNFRTNANVVFDTSLPLQERVDALQQLEQRLAVDPSRKYLAAALRKKQANQFSSFGDRILTEVFVLSERIFDWFSPVSEEHHVILTPVICLCCLVAFVFMSGSYLSYMQNAEQKACSNPSSMYGPSAIVGWAFGYFNGHWCLTGAAWQFGDAFTVSWGGRYTPLMSRRWYCFLLSALVHHSFLHLVSNLVLFLMLATEIERRYGQLRFLLLWVSSTVGGGLFSAVAEHNCNVVVGLSASVFGMIVLYMLDIWTMRKKRQVLILRTAGLVGGLLLLFTGYIVTPQGFSNWSHFGGALFGILPALLFQKHISRHEKVEAWLPLVSGCVLTVLYLMLLLIFYFHTIKTVMCGQLL